MATNQGAGAADDRLLQLKIRTEKMEHASRRIGMLLKLPLVILIAALFVWLGVTIWGAWGSRGIAIDAFHVPAAVASERLDGEAAAARMRNHLIAMQDATATSRASGVQAVNRVEDFQVEIPQTGITLGDVSRAVRSRLSRDMRVSGDITRQGNGYAINMMVDNKAYRLPEEGYEENFDLLIRQAAERVFRESNAYRYAIYLWDRGLRAESSHEFAAIVGRQRDPVERAWALNGLAANLLDLGMCAEALPLLQQAAAYGPTIPNVHGNFRNAHVCLGHDQEAADATARELLMLDTQHGQLDPERIGALRLEDWDNVAGHHGDYRRRLELYEQRDGDFSLERAEALARLHDIGGSILTVRRWFAYRRWEQEELRASRTAFWRVLAAQAAALEIWPAAASLASRTSQLVSEATSPFDRAQLRTADQPLEAIALARAGQIQRAAALAGSLPLDCYLCARSRALVADAAGDRSAADHWYRQAVRLGPRLPFAYVEYGEARLRRGEAFLALGLFDLALRHGPAFADAHKGRGDALSALGRHADALASYEAAAALAPHWGALHLRWAWALAHIGQAQEARAKTCAASRMDLGPRDRALLNRWVGLARFNC